MRLRAWTTGRYGAIALAIAIGLFASPVVSAHPLGNYSINQYSLIDLRGETPKVHYMLDIAEIPSFREMDRLDANIDSAISDEEIDAYLTERVPGIVDKITFTLNGEPVPLRVTRERLEVYEGVGGMPVFNIFLDLEPVSWSWPDGDTVIDFQSLNHAAARGYREAYVLSDGRFEVFKGPWDSDELKYLALVLEDEQGNPLFQSFYNLFRLELRPGEGLVEADHPEAFDFAWTATARSEEDEPVLLAQATRTPAVPIKTAEAPDSASGETPPGTIDKADSEVGQASGSVTVVQGRKPGKPAMSERSSAMLNRIADIIRTEEVTFPMFVIALAVSGLLGMGHAFSPGHGKTVMAAYLIGERGTVWHAFILGIIVTVTHVWSILALGVVSLYFYDSVSEEQFTFWTGVASGGIIVLIGLVLFKQRFTRFVIERYGGKNAAVAHDHGHGHDHDHDHGHGEEHHHHEHGHSHGDHGHDHREHGHSHAHAHGHHHHHGIFGHTHSHVVETEDGSPPSYKSIMWLGISGGIVPCPAAFIVLMLAINLGRLPLGLMLIVSFSVGLAAVLVGLGIAVVRASGQVRKRIGERSPILLALPVFSSVLITMLGVWLVIWTLIQHNVIVVPALG